MSDLANVNSAARGQFRAPASSWPEVRVGGVGRRPVVVARRVDPDVLDMPRGVARPAAMEYVTQNYGMTRPWANLSGAYGVIAPPSPTPDLTGGQEPWGLSRRTLRQAPTMPWDTGTELGRRVPVGAAPGAGQ